VGGNESLMRDAGVGRILLGDKTEGCGRAGCSVLDFSLTSFIYCSWPYEYSVL